MSLQHMHSDCSHICINFKRNTNHVYLKKLPQHIKEFNWIETGIFLTITWNALMRHVGNHPHKLCRQYFRILLIILFEERTYSTISKYFSVKGNYYLRFTFVKLSRESDIFCSWTIKFALLGSVLRNWWNNYFTTLSPKSTLRARINFSPRWFQTNDITKYDSKKIWHERWQEWQHNNNTLREIT